MIWCIKQDDNIYIVSDDPVKIDDKYVITINDNKVFELRYGNLFTTIDTTQDRLLLWSYEAHGSNVITKSIDTVDTGWIEYEEIVMQRRWRD